MVGTLRVFGLVFFCFCVCGGGGGVGVLWLLCCMLYLLLSLPDGI